jgi:outer membrane protein OmpA-like peptidoglycan-associated protein
MAQKVGGASIGTQRLLGQVFFAMNASALSDETTATLDGWVKELAGKPHRLAILGFSDRVGRPDYNVSLSIRRAAAVRSYLLRNGLEEGSVVVSAGGYGEEGAPVATDDNVDEPQNRTVHVYVYE